MKKVYLMKGMAAMAFGLVVASCNKFDAFNPYAEQEAKQQEFTQNFQTSVMGGQTIDQNQTWANTTATQVSVTSEVAGTLKIYTANPIGEVAAALYTQDITAGTINVTVAKPADVETLYAALINKDGSLRVTEVSNGSVKFTAPGSIPASAPRRAQAYGVTFPDAPTFPTALPPSIEQYEGGYKYYNGGSYWMDDTYDAQRLEVQGYCDMYIVKSATGDGNLTPNNYWYFGNVASQQKMRVYIMDGVTLDLGSTYFNVQSSVEYYVCNGATLKCSTTLKLNTAGVFVENGGTIIANGISINGPNSGDVYSTFYNQGTATINGDLDVTNGNAVVVNEGTITVTGNYGGTGSGSFWNVNTMTVRGTTTVNSNSAGWINEGQYTTNNFAYTAGSINVWNKCKLTVTNLFNMTLGDSSTSTFALDSKSSMVTKDFLIAGPARINMGEESIIKVTGTATMDCRKADYGIYGPTSGDKWAVFQAPSIVKGIDNQGYEVTYGGNLYVASDSHFANGMSGGYPYIDFKGNAELRDGQAAAPITIEKNGNCSDGYKGGDTPDPDPVQWYYYAFEDLGTTDDFDFNDVVIRVSAPVDNVSTVQLVAAGGTLSTTVLYNDQAFNATEVHQLFGAASTSEMVNTGKGPEKKFVTLGTITVAAGTNMANLPFGISAQGTNGQLTKVTQSVENIGKAPLVIVVAGYPSGDNAGRWFWPTERTKISDAYTDFGNWGANASSYKNWYIPENYDSPLLYQWNSSKEE